MEVEIFEVNGVKFGRLVSENIEIKEVQDALDLMMNILYQGGEGVIIHRNNLLPGFFDLKTGIAGEILQKFSTYQAKLVIIGNFNDVQDKNLKAFIYESNKAGRVSFVNSLDDGIKALLK